MPGDEGVGPRDVTFEWRVIGWGGQQNIHAAHSFGDAALVRMITARSHPGLHRRTWIAMARREAWESARGLDAAEPGDRNADAEGYTNLEAYSNELAAPAFRRARSSPSRSAKDWYATPPLSRRQSNR